MKTKIVKFIFTTLISLISIFSHAQKKPGFMPPSIDDEEIPVAKTELPVPEEGKDYEVKYFKGITDGVESRIAVKKLGYIIRPAMVQVISEDGRELAIELVKKNWDDVVRSGKTKDGKFESSFKTAMEFGIKISAKEMGIPFIVAVSAGVELFPASNLFVDARTMRSSDGYKEMSTTNETDLMGEESGQSNSILFIIIAIALVGILALLAVLVFKKKGKASFILLFFILSTSYAGLPTQILPAFEGSISGGLLDALSEHYKKGGFEGDHPLSEDDKAHEPEVDPRGQPSLPSSCYEIARISVRGYSSSGPSKEEQSDSKVQKDPPMQNSNSNNNADLDEHGRVREDIFGREIEHDDFNQPKYDDNGNPIDYPEIDRPKYDEDGNPIEYQDRDRPKYDKDGKPINYDDNSSTSKPKFDSNGDEIEYDDNKKSVYDNNGNPINYDDGKKPKYDKNGEPIKYPNATKPKYDKNGKPIKYGNGLKGSTSQAGFFSFLKEQESEEGESDNETKEGCDCLAEAYAKLQKNKHSLEKLLKIGQHTKKVTDFGISFGDDFSGVHGVSGLVWQTQRAKVLKSIEKFDITYNSKYKELIEKLYNALIRIDECEQKLGYENWYSQSGFIYYEFMKVRYAHYK